MTTKKRNQEEEEEEESNVRKGRKETVGRKKDGEKKRMESGPRGEDKRTKRI